MRVQEATGYDYSEILSAMTRPMTTQEVSQKVTRGHRTAVSHRQRVEMMLNTAFQDGWFSRASQLGTDRRWRHVWWKTRYRYG